MGVATKGSAVPCLLLHDCHLVCWDPADLPNPKMTGKAGKPGGILFHSTLLEDETKSTNQLGKKQVQRVWRGDGGACLFPSRVLGRFGEWIFLRLPILLAEGCGSIVFSENEEWAL